MVARQDSRGLSPDFEFAGERAISLLRPGAQAILGANLATRHGLSSAGLEWLALDTVRLNAFVRRSSRSCPSAGRTAGSGEGEWGQQNCDFGALSSRRGKVGSLAGLCRRTRQKTLLARFRARSGGVVWVGEFGLLM